MRLAPPAFAASLHSLRAALENACAFPQLRTLSGSNPGAWIAKSPLPKLATGFSDSVVPPAGCPRAASAARFRCVAPLLACCAGKRLRVSSAPHPVGFESRRMGSKKPATELATGFSDSVVPPAGFEPAISTLKGWRPWPLDDGDSGKEYSRLFCRRVYRWQTGKLPHRSRLLFRFSNISICNIWAGKSALSVTDRDKRRASGRTSHSVTVRRLLTV